MNDLVLISMPKESLRNVVEDAVRRVLAEGKTLTNPAPAASNEPAFLSAKEAARMVGLHPNSIWNAARDGRLTRRYIGKSVRFARADVLALAKSHSENLQTNYRNA